MTEPSRSTTEPYQLDATGSVAGAMHKREAGSLFVIAFALMVVDFADRQKAEWGLSDVQLGALVSVVSVTVAVAAFPSAVLTDRWSRVKAVGVMGTRTSAAPSSSWSSPPSTPGCPAT